MEFIKVIMNIPTVMMTWYATSDKDQEETSKRRRIDMRRRTENKRKQRLENWRKRRQNIKKSKKEARQLINCKNLNMIQRVIQRTKMNILILKFFL
jgi:hypothetical protein